MPLLLTMGWQIKQRKWRYAAHKHTNKHTNCSSQRLIHKGQSNMNKNRPKEREIRMKELNLKFKRGNLSQEKEIKSTTNWLAVSSLGYFFFQYILCLQQQTAYYTSSLSHCLVLFLFVLFILCHSLAFHFSLWIWMHFSRGWNTFSSNHRNHM